MKPYDRIYAAINLDAARFNMESMRNNLSPGTKIIGVVKADGYGHGAVPVARAIDEYVWGYAVATIWEAVNLRRHQIDKPIMVLGFSYEGTYEEYLRYHICPTVYTYETAKGFSDLAADKGGCIKVHVKIDTGMRRIGFQPDQASIEEILKIKNLPGIEIEGLFTHFAKADEKVKDFAHEQLKLFQDFIKDLEKAGVTASVCHSSNSAAIIDLSDANMDAVRAGISIYGLYPSGEVDYNHVALKPLMELKSEVIHIKDVEAGIRIGYGGIYITEKTTRVATIPVGYADGYPRNLSNKGYVLIHGRKAPLLGRICMDQMMVDITDIPNVKSGDEVILIGKSGDEKISVEELAELSGTFNYEFVCDLGKRIPRVYYENGQVTGKKDYFDDDYQ